MRGLRLEIPFEPESPVEGANLSPEDTASRRATATLSRNLSPALYPIAGGGVE